MKSQETSHILNQIEGVKSSGENKWIGNCVCHEDKHRSLGIVQKPDGEPILKCFAGCTDADLMRWKDEHRLKPRNHTANNGKPTPPPKPVKLIDEIPIEVYGEKIVEWKDYYNKHGELLYKEARTEGKKFPQLRAVGEQWAWGINGNTDLLVPYNVLGITTAHLDQWIISCEGAKDADRVNDTGQIGTSFPLGAGKFRDQYKPYFKGRNVIVVADNDTAGKDDAKQRAEGLKDVANDVRLLELPGLGDKQDISDWLDQGHTIDELITLAEQTKSYKKNSLDVTKASEIEPEDKEYWWDRRFATNTLGLIGGKQGVGKTTFGTYIVARMTKGEPLKGEEHLAKMRIKKEPVNCAYITAEDDRASVLIPKLIANGADMERVHFLDYSKEDMAKIYLDAHIDLIGNTIARHNIKLLIIDPISEHLGHVKMNEMNEVSDVLCLLKMVAKKYSCSVLIMAHPNKNTGATALDRIMGSTAFTSVPRAVWMIQEDTPDNIDDPDYRVNAFRYLKDNVDCTRKGFDWTLEGDKVIFLGGEIEETAQQMYDRQNRSAGNPGPEPNKRDEAESFLTSIIQAGHNGSPLWSDCLKRAEAKGITANTLRRAREHLGLISFKDKEKKGNNTRVTLPEWTAQTSDVQGNFPLVQDNIGI